MTCSATLELGSVRGSGGGVTGAGGPAGSVNPGASGSVNPVGLTGSAGPVDPIRELSSRTGLAWPLVRVGTGTAASAWSIEITPVTRRLTRRPAARGTERTPWRHRRI